MLYATHKRRLTNFHYLFDENLKQKATQAPIVNESKNLNENSRIIINSLIKTIINSLSNTIQNKFKEITKIL